MARCSFLPPTTAAERTCILRAACIYYRKNTRTGGKGHEKVHRDLRFLQGLAAEPRHLRHRARAHPALLSRLRGPRAERGGRRRGDGGLLPRFLRRRARARLRRAKSLRRADRRGLRPAAGRHGSRRDGCGSGTPARCRTQKSLRHHDLRRRTAHRRRARARRAAHRARSRRQRHERRRLRLRRGIGRPLHGRGRQGLRSRRRDARPHRAHRRLRRARKASRCARDRHVRHHQSHARP